MTREDFIGSVRHAVEQYIHGRDLIDANPQLRINPVTLEAILVNGSDFLNEIADNDEAIEDAAHAQGDANEEGSDRQVLENPDFYAMTDFICEGDNKTLKPDDKAIKRIAEKYFPGF